MYRIAFTIALIFGLASVAFAADPIADFCSSAQAKADAQAQAECADLAALQGSNEKIKGEKDSIEKEIKAIDSQILIAQTKIKVQERIIAQLSKDIGAKSTVVESLEKKIERQSKSMRSILQKVNSFDSISMPEIFLGNKEISEFYVQVDEYSSLNKELVALVTDVKASKAETEEERQTLQERKDKESDAKAAIEAEKRLIDRKKAEKNSLLKLKTTEYNVAQKLLTDQKAKVAAIRARLFKFADGEGIPFGDAYDYAVKAMQKTGVRPAFVLGILMQESSFDSTDSSFGKNVGQCFLRNTTTGEGVGANTGTAKIRVMNPTRDVPVFLDITSGLGRDPYNTRVSCWIPAYSKNQPYGWGGAMGPAQFIPSTWKLYVKRVASAMGVSQAEANPWNAEHAVMAASLYLSDLGAGLQTYTAEKNAACQYYSGKKCATSSDGNTYGNSVMKWVTKLQEEYIDPILGK
jgi:hypothetical protein